MIETGDTPKKKMSKQKNSMPFLSDLLTMQHDDYISLT